MVTAAFTELPKKAFGCALSFLKGRQKYQDAKLARVGEAAKSSGTVPDPRPSSSAPTWAFPGG